MIILLTSGALEIGVPCPYLSITLNTLFGILLLNSSIMDFKKKNEN
jgi:hypothetical protein